MIDDLEPYTVCDRCGKETFVVDTATGKDHWAEWAGATLCPECWTFLDDLDPYTVCDRCGQNTLEVDTSTDLDTGATLCPDCWAEVEDEETNGLLSNFRAAGDRLLASAKPNSILPQLLPTLTEMDPTDWDLILEVLTLGRDLGKDSDFLEECAQAAAAHVDAGGTDPAMVIRPILARARAGLALDS